MKTFKHINWEKFSKWLSFKITALKNIIILSEPGKFAFSFLRRQPYVT